MKMEDTVEDGRCSYFYYGETDTQLKVRSGEEIGISTLTFRKVNSKKESAIRDHHLIFIDIMSQPLTSLPSWHTVIINIFLKLKKACSLTVIDLF